MSSIFNPYSLLRDNSLQNNYFAANLNISRSESHSYCRSIPTLDVYRQCRICNHSFKINSSNFKRSLNYSIKVFTYYLTFDESLIDHLNVLYDIQSSVERLSYHLRVEQIKQHMNIQSATYSSYPCISCCKIRKQQIHKQYLLSNITPISNPSTFIQQPKTLKQLCVSVADEHAIIQHLNAFSMDINNMF